MDNVGSISFQDHIAIMWLLDRIKRRITVSCNMQFTDNIVSDLNKIDARSQAENKK